MRKTTLTIAMASVASLCFAEPDAAKPQTVEAKALQIVLPHVEFSGVRLDEALSFLRLKSRDLDPARTGINIVLTEKEPASTLTLNLREIPLSKALSYIAGLSGRAVTYTEGAAILHKPDLKLAAPDPFAAEFSRANTIILPRVIFTEVPVEDALEYLRLKTRDLDPMRKGLNILHKPGASPAPTLDLDLKAVSAAEILNYISLIAHLELTADENTITLTAKAK